jgi:hypothetical protein
VASLLENILGIGDDPPTPESSEGNVFPPVTSGQASAHPLPPGLRRGGNSVLESIESKADYYTPETYRNLLSFYSTSEFLDDVNREFIPISQTKANPKLFVVGIIPPSAPVTGNLLDRSASVGAIAGYPNQDLDYTGEKAGTNGDANASITVGESGIVTVLGYTLEQGSGTVNQDITIPNGSVGPNGDYPNTTRLSVPQIWSALEAAYKDLKHESPTPTELQFYTAQILRENDGLLLNNNFGNIGNSDTLPATGQHFKIKRADGSFGYFDSYPDVVAGAKAYIGHVGKTPNITASAKSGDVMGFMTSLAQTGYFEEPISVYYHGYPARLKRVSESMGRYGVQLDDGTSLPSGTPKSCAFTETGKHYQSRISVGRKESMFRFNSTSPYGGNCELGIPTTGPSSETNGAWVDSGSPNAAKAAAAAEKVVNTDLNSTELGKCFMNAQYAEMVQTALLIENMRNTPPLRLLVNPSTFKIASEKIVSDGNWSRNGAIVEHWGGQQDKIDASGRLAAFLAIDANNPDQYADGSSPGLTRVARNYTASFQNFLSLYLLYKNNGYLLTSGLEQSNVQGKFSSRLSLIGSVYIYYDSALYIGSFDTFTITETDDKPYTLEYNFQFTVRATFLLDRPDEYNTEISQMYGGKLPLPTTKPTPISSSEPVPLPIEYGIRSNY